MDLERIDHVRPILKSSGVRNEATLPELPN